MSYETVCEICGLPIERALKALCEECTEREARKAADLRDRAFALYTSPFRYHRGYIWDASNEMVADFKDVPEPVGQPGALAMAGAVLQIRGWGRIGYLPDLELLQDEVGRVIAAALTAAWEQHLREKNVEQALEGLEDDENWKRIEAALPKESK